jgi:glycosyltransferase involved in cell wall biosynthesis
MPGLTIAHFSRHFNCQMPLIAPHPSSRAQRAHRLRVRLPSSCVLAALVGTELARLSSSSGALERSSRAWALALAEHHEVVVVETCPASSRRTSAGPWEVLQSSPSNLARDLARLSPDVVVVSNRPAWAAELVTPTLCVLHNYPVAWEVTMTELGALRRSGALEAVTFAAVSPTLARASAVVLGRPASAIEVVPPPLDEAFLSAPRGDPRPGLLLFPHRLLRKKGLEVALAAVDLLGDHDLELVAFAHFSPWQQPTEEHLALVRAVGAAPRARLVAPLEAPSAMAEWMRAAEVVLCPSLEPEGLCIAALEAQAVGAPVVAARAGGLQDAVVRPNELVPPGDPAALASAITRARARRHDPAAQSGPASAVAARHHPARSAAVFSSALERLLERSGLRSPRAPWSAGAPGRRPLLASSGHAHDPDHGERGWPAPERA